MKKILFLGLSLFFLIPAMVSADMSAPIMTYQVVVNKQSGATLYDYISYEKLTETIPYGEELNIISEKVKNGKVYGSINYNGKYYKILLDETEFFGEEYDLKNAWKLKETEKVIVYGDYDSYLYKGPSKIYDKVSDIKIPVGTVLEYDYIGNSEGSPAWAYVTYNGTSGWLYIYTIEDSSYDEIAKAATYNSNDDKKLAASDINLNKEATLTSEKLDVVIPVNTEIKYEYSLIGNSKTTYYYVTYNGVSGWLTSKEVAKSLNQDIEWLLKNDVNGYNLPNKDSEVAELISSGSIIKHLYHISIMNSQSETGFNNYKYIEVNGKRYWVLESELDDEIINNEDASEKNEDASKELEDNKINEGSNQTKENLTPFQVMYICVGAAGLLSLISIIVIKLINKKDKENL